MPELRWTTEQEELLSGRFPAVASAGAGTGKTTFIIEKVRRAASAGLAPDRAVCITFTNRAAGELKSRAREAFQRELRRGGEPEVWRRRLRLLESAPLCTLHSLAGQLLRRHPVEAGVDVGFAALDERQASSLRSRAADAALRDWLSDDAAGDYRALLRVRYGVRDGGRTKSLVTLLEGCVDDFFRAGGDEAFLQAGIETNWREDPKAGAEFARVLAAASAEYRKLKGERLDFDDLLLRARDLLRNNAALRREYQTRFGLILLDEAQDTNPVQMEMVRLLAGEEGLDRLCVVGDRKQAIYRFQGADSRQFEAVIAGLKAAGGRVIALQDNRRCAPGIIDFVNALSAGGLFEGVLPYEPARDDLVARRPVRNRDCVWRIISGAAGTAGVAGRIGMAGGADARRQREAETLARLVSHLTDPERSTVRVYDSDRPGDPGRVPRFGDIALLLTKTTNLVYYTSALQAAGVPYFTESGRGFFRLPAVADAAAFLRTVQNPRDEAAGAALLRSPAFGLNDAEWLALGMQHGAFRLDVFAAKLAGPKESARSASGTEPLAERADDSEPPPAPPHVRALMAVWQSLHRGKDKMAPAELLERWWAAAGEQARAAAGPQPRQKLANLNKLLRIARDFAAGRGGLTDDPHRTLREFVDFLADAADAKEPDAAVVGPNDDVVRVMTAHKSKGLEFPIVILADTVTQAVRPPGDALLFDRQFGLVGKVYDAEADKLAGGEGWKRWADAEKREAAADQRRLLYVAATRARDLLVLSGEYALSKKGNPISVQCWRKWIDETPAAELIREVHIDDLDCRDDTAAAPAWGGPPPEPDLTSPPRWPGELRPDELASADAIIAQAASVPVRSDKKAIRRMTVAELMDRRAERRPAEIGAGAPPTAEDPAEVGEFVHGLLELIDFSAPPDPVGLARIAVNRGWDPARAEVRRALDCLHLALSERRRALPVGVPPEDIRRELPISWEIVRGGRTLLVEGTADLLWRDRGLWRLADFKTGPHARPDSYAFQISVYAAALAARGIVVRSGSVVFLGEADPQKAVLEVPFGAAGEALEEELFALAGFGERGA